MIRRPPRSTQSRSSAASDVYKRQVGNRVMSSPTSAIITLAVVTPTPGIGSRQATTWSERGDLVLDPGLDLGDVGVDGVDPGEHLGQQERVVAAEPADEGLLQLADLDAHAGTGQLREDLRVAFSSDQRGHHRPTGDRRRCPRPRPTT